MVEYLTDERLTAAKRTATPQNPYASGYGNKIPTSYMVQVDGKPRWYRVYVSQYSNAGSAYIVLHGKLLFIQSETYLEIQAERYNAINGARQA